MSRVGRQSWIGVVALTSILGLAFSANATATSVSTDRLSDRDGVTHWAHPQGRAFVRRLPSPTSQRVADVHLLTEDGFPEVYPVLERLVDSRNRHWLRIRVPVRRQVRTGWVRDAAMGPPYPVVTHLVIDRVHLRADLYRSGKAIWGSRIGIGKVGTPTPVGSFWVREKFRVRGSGGLYGPAAFGTSAYSRLSDWPGGGVIGIHGTDQPRLIPGRPSHGCIRVPNSKLMRLYHLMPIGTPVTVR